MRKCLLLVGLSSIAIAGLANASETITYRYDARGRLTKVERCASGNNATTTYAFDKADNRTQLTVTSEAGGGGQLPLFCIANTSVGEGGLLVFTVTKTGAATGTHTVNFTTASGGTATSGSDFTPASGTLTFAPFETFKTLSVATADDLSVEQSETVLVSLSSPSGAATIARSQASGTIIDNDAAFNNPPLAANDSISLPKCSVSASLNLISNDSDPDGDLPLILISLSGSSDVASANIADNSSIYIDTYGTAGTGSFYYTVQDSRGATSSGTVNVTVTGGFQPIEC